MMATLKDVSQIIRNGDWAATIDLKAAYFHVPIARVTEGSSVLLLGPARRSSCQLWLCAGKRGFDWWPIWTISWSWLGTGGSWFLTQYSRHFRPGWIPPKLEEMPSATQTEVRILVPAAMLPADKITRFSSIRISIESLSEDGSNISRQMWTWVEYIFVPCRYRWKGG